MGGLYDKLKGYGESDAYPFHMPGHKRVTGIPAEACGIDITEIDGFDNLHHAEGILREAQQRAARLYGSEDTYFLVNGSTAGILAAIFACTTQNGKILMARGSHKAAYHAAELRGLRTVYLYAMAGGIPGGSISPADVRSALASDPEIQAVFVTSPTYEGVVSDVEAIAEIAHEFDCPLIVDEAHGAHFGFHPYFPEGSVKKGADLVIHSVHKTLPSMTQTALLHRNGIMVSGERVQKYLGIFQTSSPSYVLMASIDDCIARLQRDGDGMFAAFAERLQAFARRAETWRHIRLLRGDGENQKRADASGNIRETAPVYAQDFSKLVLCADGCSGTWLSDTLRRKYGLEMEMEAGSYVIALTSVADTDEGFARLEAALDEIDGWLCECAEDHSGGAGEDDMQRCDAKQRTDEAQEGASMLRSEQVFTIAQADLRQQATVPLKESAGKISAEYCYLYPPGVPLLVPGERISEELLQKLEKCRAAGLSLQGLRDYSGKTIAVCAEARKPGNII